MGMAVEGLAEPVWLPVANAARRLGVTEQAVRRRIRAGTIETRREVVGNKARTLVRVDAPATEQVADVVEVLREHVARLEADVADLRAERDRHLAIIEELASRRRWPGLVPWLRRVLYGEG